MTENHVVDEIADRVTGEFGVPGVSSRVILVDGHRWGVIEAPGVTYRLPSNNRDDDFANIEPTELTASDKAWLEERHRADGEPGHPGGK